MTPLGWDFAEAGFHESLRHSLALMGFPPFQGKWFALFDGYVYGNESAVKLFLGARRFPFRTEVELRALLPRARDAYGWVFELPAAWARDLDRFLLGVGRLSAESAPGPDPREHWARVLRIERLGREYFRPNIAISITHGLLHRSLFQALALFFPVPEAKSLYDRLTRVCDTKTSAVNAELFALARAARADPALRARLAEIPSRALLSRGELDAWPAFASAFARFVEDHAHRESDPDPYQPTWGDAPWVVMAGSRAHPASRRVRCSASVRWRTFRASRMPPSSWPALRTRRGHPSSTPRRRSSPSRAARSRTAP